MSTEYAIRTISIPDSCVHAVEQLILEHDLTRVLEVEVGCDGVMVLEQQESIFSHSTAESLDDFVEALAGVLCGTDGDGQSMDYEWAGEKGLYIFLNGKRHDIVDGPVIPLKGARPGEIYMALVRVKVFGLPNNEAIIISPTM